MTLLLRVTLFASLGVFLFGYDQGVVSGILTNSHFKSFFGDPTPYEIGTVVAILQIGAFSTCVTCAVACPVLLRRAQAGRS